MIQPKKISSNYHRFDIPMESNSEKWMFTCSDVHFDNPKCNRELFFKHMDRALELDAMITITGDFFCLMQGAYDPRKSKSSILLEHNEDNYLDLVINDAANRMIPYAKNIILISRGNHETSVSKRNETDVMERFVERLNLLADSNIQIGNYLGYYTLNFSYTKGGDSKPINVAYSHGHWGGIVTKGALSVMRYSAMFPDADIIFSGHTHDSYIMTQPRYRIRNQAYKVQIEKQWHVKTGTYKEEFAEGRGWASERIGVPKHLGGAFTRFDYKKNNPITFEITLTH